MNYHFNEKTAEWSSKQRKEIPVWQSPKYEQSKQKAIEIIDKYDDITEADFWILMNETKTEKMAYTGLIISHNGCLKLNDHLSEDLQFVPSCMSFDKDGYNGSLVYTYVNDKQGLYEVGEVSSANCKNSYPYAMALKRCFDRVVLKNSKLAYSGVYSDSEADEFAERVEDRQMDDLKAESKAKLKESKTFTFDDLKSLKETDFVPAGAADYLLNLASDTNSNLSELYRYYEVSDLSEMTVKQFRHCLNILEKRQREQNGK